jgi:N-glycosylase/DNA lyase
MKILAKDNSIIVKNVRDFNPTHTFMCGQCFRWDMEEDGSYTGIAHGKVVNVSYIENDIIIKNTNIDDVKNIWIDYLDLNRDYDEIKSNFLMDENLKRAIEFGGGIKICPKAQIDDGLLDFVVAGKLKKIKIPRAFLKLMKGKILECDFTSFERRERVKIDFDKPVTIQIDGELYDGIDFDVSFVKGGINIFRP